MDALLTHLRTWDPNGNGLLTPSQLTTVLKELDSVFWNDDNISLLLTTLPHPLSIESLVSFIYSTADPSPDAGPAIAEERGMKVLAERATIDAALCRKLTPEEKDTIRSVFTRYDKDGSGNIDLRELGKMASELGGKLTEDEVQLAMQQLDKDESGRCEFDEFCLWWASKPTLGGYDEVTLQVMKTVLAARTAASKLWSSKLSELKSMRLPEKMSMLRGSVVISPKMDAFESKTKCKVTVKKVSESKIPFWTGRLVASSAKSALEVTEAFTDLFAMMTEEAPSDIPFTLAAEQMGNCVEIKIRSKEDHAEKLFKKKEFRDMMQFLNLALDTVDATVEWSNDFESMVAEPEKPLLEHIGGVKVSLDCMINYGLIGDLIKEEFKSAPVESALEILGGIGLDVKFGYHKQHLASLDSELKEMKIKMHTLKKGQDELRADLERKGGETPEDKKANLKKFAVVLKNLAENVINAEAMTIGGIGTIQVRLEFERFRPWFILQYILQPLLEQAWLERHRPPPMAAFSEVRDIGDKERQRILKVFKQYDKDGSGAIDLAELETMVIQLGGKLTAEEVKLAMEQLDKDGSNTCNWPEFELWWSSKPGLGGYSSATLAFLRMKVAGWDYLLKGKRFLVTNSFGVNEDDDSLLDSSVDFCSDTSASVHKVATSIKFSQETASMESCSQPALEARLLAKSSDDAAACVALIQEELEKYAEMLERMPIEVSIKCDDVDAAVVLVKVTVNAEVAAALAAKGNPILRTSLVTALQALLTSEASLSLGSTFEELLTKPDEPLTELLNGVRCSVKTGFSAAGRQMMASMTVPGFKNIFRPMIRGFAGFSIGTSVGYRPKALTKLLKELHAPALSLSELSSLIQALFPEELAIFLPCLDSLCKSLKGVESISIKGYIPKPDSDGCKVDINVSFEAFNVFCVVAYLFKPLISPSDS